ncbi:MAG: hypothetical protein ABS44_01770 [Chryseobacterium sp. SCN 40-13]|nr:MAG: hypothetical protein ABS44_01770 [Chryseobacterium sp. SCN 40-13]
MLSYEYRMFPAQFKHCLLAECPHSSECLRFIAFTLIPETVESFTLLNPEMLRTQDLFQCKWLLTGEPQIFARGLRKTLENLPNNTLKNIRRDLILLLGRTAYYRHFRNELWLTPVMQSQIREIFLKYDVEQHLDFPESAFFI